MLITHQNGKGWYLAQPGTIILCLWALLLDTSDIIDLYPSPKGKKQQFNLVRKNFDKVHLKQKWHLPSINISNYSSNYYMPFCPSLLSLPKLSGNVVLSSSWQGDCNCTDMKSFLGGGTGSGLGSLLLKRLWVDYGKKSKLLFTVNPSPQVSTSTEWWSSTLVSSLLEYTDVVVLLDN